MKQMPKELPPLPEGYVYLGRGGDFVPPSSYAPMIILEDAPQPKWDNGADYNGKCSLYHYAAPADSEIAKLNGYSPKDPTLPNSAVEQNIIRGTDDSNNSPLPWQVHLINELRLLRIACQESAKTNKEIAELYKGKHDNPQLAKAKTYIWDATTGEYVEKK